MQIAMPARTFVPYDAIAIGIGRVDHRLCLPLREARPCILVQAISLVRHKSSEASLHHAPKLSRISFNSLTLTVPSPFLSKERKISLISFSAAEGAPSTAMSSGRKKDASAPMSMRNSRKLTRPSPSTSTLGRGN